LNRLFVTGMGRSGTSLLEKLLTNHPDIDLLAQPFPLVFVEAKRQFLAAMGDDRYYVLNQDFFERPYSQEQFDTHLQKLLMSPAQLDQLFERMKSYSGQQTHPDTHVGVPGKDCQGCVEILKACLARYGTSDVRYTGMKEIMCEEFLPYLGQAGYRCIVIVRDPRAVLASANYPRTERYLGAKKPALFLLRGWRKSIEYAHMLEGQAFFHMLRYEDLVSDPVTELRGVTTFLGLDPFDDHFVERDLTDRKGGPWQANTSGDKPGHTISDASIEAWKQVLGESEAAYAQAVCCHEMRWLGYPVSDQADAEAVIRGFRDRDLEDQYEIAADYSSTRENVDRELRRLTSFQDFYPVT